MRKTHWITAFIVLVLCIYLGFTFYSRRRDNLELLRRLEEDSRSRQPKVIEAYRGTELKIVFFYASPGTINKGQKTQLCYGIINSEKARMEPPVKNVWPALSNCVAVEPRTTTTYKLIAEDAKGFEKSAQTTVEVF